MKLPEIPINIGKVRGIVRALSKTETKANAAKLEAEVFARVFSAMIFHHTDEVEIVKDEGNTSKRVVKFNPGPLTALGLPSDIAMQLSLTAELIKIAGSQTLCRTTQTAGLIAQSVETAGDLQIQSRRLAGRLPIINACRESLARKKHAIGTDGVRLLQKPEITTEEMALQFRLNATLTKQENSLREYVVRITNGAKRAEDRADRLGIPEIIIAAAMVSGWEQGGLPPGKIDRGITDTTLQGKLTFVALRTILFEE